MELVFSFCNYMLSLMILCYSLQSSTWSIGVNIAMDVGIPSNSDTLGRFFIYFIRGRQTRVIRLWYSQLMAEGTVSTGAFQKSPRNYQTT